MRVILIDGPYLTYRAFCAASIDGMVKHSLSVLLDMLDEYDEVWVAWEKRDGTGPELRRKDLADYKHGRTQKPSEYFSMLTDMQDTVLPLMGVHQLWPEMGEADDIALVFCERHREDEVVLWARDKDWLQLLVHENVKVLQPPHTGGMSGGEFLTAATMLEKTGIGPERWTAHLALAGDAADNIPGLPQIGDQRSRLLLKVCPQLVDLVFVGKGDLAVQAVMRKDAALAKWAQKVADNRELLDTMYRLVTLRSVPVEERRGTLNVELARPVLEGLGCSWAADRLGKMESDDWGDTIDDWA